MVKVCTHCEAQYWARWRNEPTTLCPDCRDDAVLCLSCGQLTRPMPDPRQLTLWPMHMGARALSAVHDDTYTSPPRVASQAARRKYPYQ